MFGKPPWLLDFFFFFWMGERVGHTPRTEPVIIGGTFIPNLCLWMRDAKIQQMGTQSAALYFSVSGEQERGWGLELRELPGRWQKRASPWGLRPRQEAVLGRRGRGGVWLTPVVLALRRLMLDCYEFKTSRDI